MARKNKETGRLAKQPKPEEGEERQRVAFQAESDRILSQRTEAERLAARERAVREGTTPQNPIYNPTAPNLGPVPVIGNAQHQTPAQLEAQIDPQYQTPAQQAESVNHASIKEVEVSAPASSLSREAFREEIRRKTATVKPFDDGQTPLTNPLTQQQSGVGADAYNPNQTAELVAGAEEKGPLSALDAGDAAVKATGGHIQELGEPRAAESIISDGTEISSGNKPGDTQIFGKPRDLFLGLDNEDDRIVYARQVLERAVDLEGVIKEISRERYTGSSISLAEIKGVANCSRSMAIGYVIANPEDFDFLPRIAEGFADMELGSLLGKDDYVNRKDTVKLPVVQDTPTQEPKPQKPKKPRMGLAGLLGGTMLIGGVLALGAGIIKYLADVEYKKEVPPTTYHLVVSGTEEKIENPFNIQPTLNSGTTQYTETPVSSNAEPPTPLPSPVVPEPENFQKTPEPREVEVPVIQFPVDNLPDDNTTHWIYNPISPTVELDDPELVDPALTNPVNPAQVTIGPVVEPKEKELTDVERARINMANNIFNNSSGSAPYTPAPNVPMPFSPYAPPSTTYNPAIQNELNNSGLTTYVRVGVTVPVANKNGAPKPIVKVEGGAGWRFSSGLEVQAEGAYSEHHNKTVNGANELDLREKRTQAGINILYNQPINEWFEFTVGSGFGWTGTSANLGIYNGGNEIGRVTNDEDDAYIKLITGMNCNLGRGWKLGVFAEGETNPGSNAGYTVTGSASAVKGF